MADATLKLLENWMRAWVGLCYRRAAWVLLTAAALFALALTSALRLSVNTDSSEMLDASLPYRVAQAKLDSAFPILNDTIAILVTAPTPDAADYFSAELLRAFAARGDLLQDAYAPTQDAFFLQNGLLFLSDGELEAHLGQLSKAAPFFTALGENPSLGDLFSVLAENAALAEERGVESTTLDSMYRAIADAIEGRLAGRPVPMSWAGLVEDDETDVHRRALSVRPKLDFARLQPAKASLEAIDAAVAEAKARVAPIEVEVDVTGNPVLRTDELRSVSTGIGVSLGLSGIFVIVILVIAFRSATMVATAVSCVLFSLVVTAGLTALIFGSLNLVSIAFAVLLLGLGVDFVIHFTLHIQEARQDGLDIPAALERSTSEVGGALALCVPTTAIAFLAFAPTQFVGMAQLGVISACGVFVAYFAAVSIVPAVLRYFPVRATPRPAPERLQRFRARMKDIGRPVALTVLALSVASLALLPSVRFSADPMALRDPNSQSVVAFNKLFEQRSTAPYRLDVIAQSPADIEKLSDDLQDLPEVDRVVSVGVFTPEDQDAKLDLIDFAAGGLLFALDSGGGGASVPTEDGAAQLLSVVGGVDARGEAARLAAALKALMMAPAEAQAQAEGDVFKFWPFQRSRLVAQLTPSKIEQGDLPASLKDRYLSAAGEYRLEVIPSLDVSEAQARAQFVRAVAEVAPEASGSALNVIEAGEAVARAMLQATATAAILVSLLLYLLLRRVLLVGLILFPLILAAVLTSATGVILNQPYNFANVIVLPLLIGLGVDSGIHLVLRARQVARGAVAFHTSTARAVFFSALTTIASFGTLALSAHRGTSSMGVLLMVAVFYTLICTLVVLPVALDAIYRRERR